MSIISLNHFFVELENPDQHTTRSITYSDDE